MAQRDRAENRKFGRLSGTKLHRQAPLGLEGRIFRSTEGVDVGGSILDELSGFRRALSHVPVTKGPPCIAKLRWLSSVAVGGFWSKVHGSQNSHWRSRSSSGTNQDPSQICSGASQHCRVCENGVLFRLLAAASQNVGSMKLEVSLPSGSACCVSISAERPVSELRAQAQQHFQRRLVLCARGQPLLCCNSKASGKRTRVEKWDKRNLVSPFLCRILPRDVRTESLFANLVGFSV